VIIENDRQKKATTDASPPAGQTSTSPVKDPPEQPISRPHEQKEIHTTTQWLSVISICISLLGIYYKREEIKKMLTPKTTPPVDISRQASEVDTSLSRKGIHSMD